eukprot:2728571-Pleurochrysis_carterae.AAC.1
MAGAPLTQQLHAAPCQSHALAPALMGAARRAYLFVSIDHCLVTCLGLSVVPLSKRVGKATRLLG